HALVKQDASCGKGLREKGLMHLQGPGRLWVVSCKFRRGLDGSKGSSERRRFVPAPSSEQINVKHPLVRLAGLINWDRLGASMSASFVSRKGRPGGEPVLAGLHRRDVSADRAAGRCVEPDTLARAVGQGRY